MTTVAQKIDSVKDGEIVLFVSKAQNLLANDLSILKAIIKKVDQGVYITINQPYASLQKILANNKINTQKLFFIDLISSTVSARPEKTERCLFVNSPTGLTDLSIAIEQLLEIMPGEKTFLFIDNLTAFLIYNQLDVTSKFIHFLVNKMRIKNILGVIMSIEEEMGVQLINTISGFCDKVIKLE